MPDGSPQESNRGLVLLVDDDTAVRRLLKVVLERLGFQVLEANAGTQAVAMFAERGNEICCLVLDVVMPGMDGSQTLKYIRQMSPALPAIMVSGYDMDDLQVVEPDARPTVYLRKPCTHSELQDAMALALA